MSSNSSKQTVSDALLDVQHHPNRRRRIQRFGVVMLVMLLLGSLLLPYTLSLGIVAVGVGGITVFSPQLLSPIYSVLAPLFSIGLNLLLTLLFYIIITPIALVSRFFGIDFIQRNLEPEVQSYWIERQNLLPHGKYMKSLR
ncbi:MAG: hypothetical protein F6K63_35340 [Moorea sp. SIO1G6]|uniref:hypothetical protein n=1 Tax=unclassified Moorena TaxID=2683338 RepID=UPI0013BD472B|nr:MULTISPECIES: hypothetical protein [unclassified Moorena]NEQ07192.1 hypothetical protein [Moorena sp. SIO4E2]NEQ12533.1 hypothetical protein [Moorena sp. SIO3E2]NES84678.1 hypothetical protein [Moorena sp. SIO2B7]NET69374.1 hypothetical protein [Moorena sp. SIO1G6]